MTPDSLANALYLADCLPEKQPIFFARFVEGLNECGIKYTLLPGTKDIWAVDYMPVQIDKDKFVQFTYNPGYLQGKKWQKTISDVGAICKAINISPVKSNILLDGGNIIRSKDKVIMTDRIFEENPRFAKTALIAELEILFETAQLIFVPSDPTDFTGHADGMLRFVDEDTVLINKYAKEDAELERAFKAALKKAKLEWIEIPYNPYQNKSKYDAKGVYINYLQMKGIIIIPTFGIKEDNLVVRQLTDIFKGQTIKTVKSNEIALEGGVLNCITWNILQ